MYGSAEELHQLSTGSESTRFVIGRNWFLLFVRLSQFFVKFCGQMATKKWPERLHGRFSDLAHRWLRIPRCPWSHGEEISKGSASNFR